MMLLMRILDRFVVGVVLLLSAFVSTHALAEDPIVPAAKDVDPNDPEVERASFKIAEGYEVNLFASEKLGIANPIQMRWDAAGRLYVISTPLYPQITPGERPNDKIIVLEDVDGDGVADRSTVFADGLFMPEGLEVGDGGVYVGSGNDLLHLKDTNGDGRADQRRIVLTGFGTGDTHQLINNFNWSPSGALLFCQGLHIFSRVETPWGNESLNNAGVWRLRPRRLQLDPFLGNEMVPHNPWGIQFDDWGQPILIAGNGHGIFWMTAAMVRHSFQRPLKYMWARDKLCGGEFLGGGHFGEETADVMVTGGFMNNTVLRFRVRDDLSELKLEELSPLIVSDHRSFRPVDLKTGPDGALYISDWYNPIIGHYQASYRHPSRDHHHGRIWRVTKKGRATLPRPKLVEMSVPVLLEKLRSPERWVRYQTRRLLQDAETDKVIPAVKQWVAQLDPAKLSYEQLLYRAIGVCESHEAVVPELLEKLMAAKDSRARAYAARVVGNWQDRLDDPLALLTRLVQDPNSRVRLEAVVACGYVRKAEAMEVAAMAVDQSMNHYLDFALHHVVHELGPYWRDAFIAGEIDFDRNAERLVFVLNADASQKMLSYLQDPKLVGRLGPKLRAALLASLASVGNASELQFVFDHPEVNASMLDGLAIAWRIRKQRPAGEVLPRMKQFMGHADETFRAAAIQLAGVWGLKELGEPIEAVALGETQPLQVRLAAIRALPSLRGVDSLDTLKELAQDQQPHALWPAAIAALADLDIGASAKSAAALILRSTDEEETSYLLAPLLGRNKGAASLAAALDSRAVTAEIAKRCRRAMNAAGVTDKTLAKKLDDILGLTSEERKFDLKWIATLAAEVKADGNVERGRGVFQSSVLNCAACHAVYGVGGKVGPDLSSVGRAMPVDRIIEEVLWPERQIKEGYVSILIITKEGRIFQGVKVRESPHEIVLRDAVSKGDQRIPWREVDEYEAAGTLMPSGLTTALSRSDLRDLIAYLSKLDGSKNRPDGTPANTSDAAGDKK